jgi:hypothetical protein
MPEDCGGLVVAERLGLRQMRRVIRADFARADFDADLDSWSSLPSIAIRRSIVKRCTFALRTREKSAAAKPVNSRARRTLQPHQ